MDFVLPAPAALLCAGRPPTPRGPSRHLTPYPILPPKVEGSFVRSLLGGKHSQPLFYPFQTSSHLRQPPAPKVRHGGQAWGEVGPHCAPAPHVPCLPLVLGGFGGGLVSEAAQRLFSNHYSGISVLQGGEVAAACPAKDLAVDKILGDGGTLVASAGFQVPPVPSQDLGADPTEGSWATPGTFLRSQDSLLCPHRLWAGA